MAEFMLGIFFLFLAFVFWVVTITLKAKARPEESEMPVATAIVAGFSRDQHSSWHTLRVRIPELSEDGLYDCQSGRIETKNYPIGSEVQVYYTPSRYFGGRFYTIYLKDNMPISDQKLAHIFKVLTIITALIGLALMAIHFIWEVALL